MKIGFKLLVFNISDDIAYRSSSSIIQLKVFSVNI
jgi:hypothetical protein